MHIDYSSLLLVLLCFLFSKDIHLHYWVPFVKRWHSVINQGPHSEMLTWLFILSSFQGLSDPSNYHEFCRLLARLKSNYQLGELVKVDNYPEVIKLIAEFTVTSLRVSRWMICHNHHPRHTVCHSLTNHGHVHSIISL